MPLELLLKQSYPLLILLGALFAAVCVNAPLPKPPVTPRSLHAHSHSYSQVFRISDTDRQMRMGVSGTKHLTDRKYI